MVNLGMVSSTIPDNTGEEEIGTYRSEVEIIRAICKRLNKDISVREIVHGDGKGPRCITLPEAERYSSEVLREYYEIAILKLAMSA